MTNATSGRSTTPLALVVSFLVYAIPLPGPHAVPLLGASIVAGFSRPAANSLAVPLAVFAIAAQVLTFFVLRWCLGERRRLLLLGAYVPALVIVTYVSAMLLIPRAVLIASDAAPENLSWPVACAAKDASVHAVRSSPGGALGRAGETWVRTGDGTRFGLMRGGDCVVSPLSLPPNGTMHAIVFALPGGISLESTWDVPSQQTLWWHRSSFLAEALPVPTVPEASEGPPILSEDGFWLVTVKRPGPPPASPHIVLRRFDDSATRVIDLDPLGLGSYAPLGAKLRVDKSGRLDGGELQLARNDEEFLSVDLDGRPTSTPLRPEGVDASALSFRRIENGWAAWDAYVEDRPYAIVWNTSLGRGSHIVPKGRGITSLDLDPEGRWIAYSTSPVYNLGGVTDAVIIISATDGKEVFRDSLPAYTRSDVVFVGPGRLAYTAWHGIPPTEARVIVAPR